MRWRHFICLSAIYTLSNGICLYMFLPIFLLGSLVFSYWPIGVIYIFWMWTFVSYMSWQIMFPLCDLSFYTLWLTDMWKLLILLQLCVLILSSVLCTFVCICLFKEFFPLPWSSIVEDSTDWVLSMFQYSLAPFHRGWMQSIEKLRTLIKITQPICNGVRI